MLLGINNESIMTRGNGSNIFMCDIVMNDQYINVNIVIPQSLAENKETFQQ